MHQCGPGYRAEVWLRQFVLSLVVYLCPQVGGGPGHHQGAGIGEKVDFYQGHLVRLGRY